MELKLFGKNILEFNSKGSAYYSLAQNEIKSSNQLPDFLNFLSNRVDMSEPIGVYSESITISDFNTIRSDSSKSSIDRTINAEKKRIGLEKIKLTPKHIYDCKMLNENSFKLNTDPDYVNIQLSDFKNKLALLKTESDYRRGVSEICSIIIRLQNRKEYSKFKSFFEEYAYTTTSKVQGFIKAHNYLKLDKVEQFVADMPKEATQAMRDYNAKTKEMCKKSAIFYIIADQADFRKTAQRRDPILLAQSPFAHVWQILGAWDKEMLMLEEL